MKIPALFLSLAAILPAQNAIVQNAASATAGCPGFAFGEPVLVQSFVNPFLAGFLYAGGCVVGSPIQNIVTPGMLAVLYYQAGPNLALSNQPAPALPVALSIRASGSEYEARLKIVSYTSSSVTFAIPRNMPLGGAQIEYKISGQPTAWTDVNIIPASFNLFRIGSNGPAIAQLVSANGSLAPIGLTTPAQPGQTIRLTGTGLGNSTSPAVTVGGVSATLVAAQPRLAQPGIEEIRFQMPAAAPDGCYVPLVVSYGNANVTTTITKTSNGAPCVHPFQLSTADMKTLDNGGYLTAAGISMNSSLAAVTASAAHRNEGASIEPVEMNAASIASLVTAAPAASGCSAPSLIPANSVLGVIGGIGFGSIGSPPPPPPDFGSMTLQNGATSLTFPGFSSQSFASNADGILANPPAPEIAGGKWTWQSAGAAALAASTFAFTLPAPFQLTGTTQFSIARTQAQTLTWNDTGFDSGAVVHLSLSGTAASGGFAAINCSVAAAGGTLTIPADLLSNFAAGILGSLVISVQETGASIPHTQFRLTDGSTLLMYVNYSSSESLPVDIE